MHVPVLMNEVLQYLSPQEGKTYVDATFGGGGYTRAILEHTNCNIIAFDRDPDAIQRAQSFVTEFKDRFSIFHCPFSEMDKHLTTPVDGIVFDYGVSSYQLDEADRGFSFRQDGPLDMRMSQVGQSVADVVNNFSESDLADIIYYYGDETQARKIARGIIEARKIEKILTTGKLAEIIKQFVKRKDGIDPATKAFQALRIYVNNELIEIDMTLVKTLDLIADKGRLVTVTFHSLEDRIVKNFLRKHNDPSYGAYYKTVTRQAVPPTDQEIRENPRSRSAKLRCAELVRNC